MSRKKLLAARLATVDPNNYNSGFQYFADALFSAEFYESNEIDTMAIDKYWRIIYSPTFVQELTLDQTIGVLVHEIMHPTLNHHQRCEAGGFNPKLWNIAADMEINDCPKLKSILPKPHVQAEDEGFPEGKTAEWYYAQLCKDPPPQDKPKCTQCGSENLTSGQSPLGKGFALITCDDCGHSWTVMVEEGQGPGGGGGIKSEESGDGEGQGDGEGESDTSGGVGNGDCGSGADGKKRAWDLPAPSEGGPPGLDDLDQEILKRKIAKTITESSLARGDLPAGMVRLMEEMLKPPKIRWQQELRAVARRVREFVRGNTDYSYRFPSYRQSMAQQAGAIFPGSVSPVPRVYIVVDTSGSVSDGDLAEFGPEIQGIFRETMANPPRIVSCDSEAGTIQTYKRIKDVKLTGGGGTDMRVGIDACLRERLRPNVIVVLTDGGTPWPEESVEGVKIIGVIGGRCSYDSTPEWMPSIILEGGE